MRYMHIQYMHMPHAHAHMLHAHAHVHVHVHVRVAAGGHVCGGICEHERMRMENQRNSTHTRLLVGRLVLEIPTRRIRYRDRARSSLAGASGGISARARECARGPRRLHVYCASASAVREMPLDSRRHALPAALLQRTQRLLATDAELEQLG